MSFKVTINTVFPKLRKTIHNNNLKIKDIKEWKIDYYIDVDDGRFDISFTAKGNTYKEFCEAVKEIHTTVINYGLHDPGKKVDLQYRAGMFLADGKNIYNNEKHYSGFPTQISWVTEDREFKGWTDYE